MRFRSGPAALGAVVLLSVGCTHGSPKPSASPTPGLSPLTSQATTAAPITGLVGASTSAPTSSTPTTSGASIPRCVAGGLALTLSDLGAAAGTAYRELLFKNTSARTCTMRGYAGVSFLDGRGRQIGAPVPRMSGSDGLVTLAPGATAAALMAYHDVYVSTFPNCQPTTAAALGVFPPDDTAALSVATNMMVCANRAATGAAGVSPVTTPDNLHP